ncbi:hypothetical protein Cal7507_2612 [Calothrix sp. PCC 7507]|nr:hypothetical protein Cal7507_2612 [Calothrix sp. PCC 7507]
MFYENRVAIACSNAAKVMLCAIALKEQMLKGLSLVQLVDSQANQGDISKLITLSILDLYCHLLAYHIDSSYVD